MKSRSQRSRPTPTEAVASTLKMVDGRLNVSAIRQIPLQERERFVTSLWWWQDGPLKTTQDAPPWAYREDFEYPAFLHELEARDHYRKEEVEYKWAGAGLAPDFANPWDLVNLVHAKYPGIPDRTVLLSEAPRGPDPTLLRKRYLPCWINMEAHDKEIISRLREDLRSARAFFGVRKQKRTVEFAVPWDGIEAIDRDYLLSRPDNLAVEKRHPLTFAEKKAKQRAWALLDEERARIASWVADLKATIDRAERGDSEGLHEIWVAFRQLKEIRHRGNGE